MTPFRNRQSPPERPIEVATPLFLTLPVANIIMQLAEPRVGEGVAHSRVDSGSAFKRAVKRSRTTAQYLAVAIAGSDADRQIYRDAVREAHSHVRSEVGDKVRYSANDPKLQLWVAMCLFKGYIDSWELLYGPLDEAAKDTLLANSATLGTTLEMRQAQWPASWAEFDRQFTAFSADFTMTAEVRDLLSALADLSFLNEQWGVLGRAISTVAGPVNEFFTKATLPPRFRELMGWEWTEADERLFALARKGVAAVDFVAPWTMKAYWGLYLVDMRIRTRLGAPILGKLVVRPRDRHAQAA
ncbi:oxygenase MpaB family protein [Mycolicibacterium brumae]|uniref:DUF2236 domain-containing protein n=1 Tax=Mycolicibacterium brumae TaxID=85968 RepID=A0A2G5PD39_9MYCO|nr:oxygenase MpaB family protein [Mycolicibacterium brumae]MCV7191880.1 DUF2236 domain-containing protein [Mycolicibacterium brumae]PIB76246.1 DUF2236 domain-containing protein [Mycolicibacterium brumae]RWA15741.1 hypothetical protein MBRU_09320 [Mycolicibacterium brumae DSM 44177]UWW07186.1 oxygenase MpaB family protein [Mycolicibacterium brumae]